MSGTELVLLEGRPGDEDGNGWQPALTLDHGGPGHHELFVIVGEEAAGMAEHVSDEMFEQLRAWVDTMRGLEPLVRRLIDLYGRDEAFPVDESTSLLVAEIEQKLGMS